MRHPPTWNLFGEDHLPHRLLLLAKMIDRDTARQLQSEFSLSLADWRVLAYVGGAGPSSAADIGQAFESDRAEISRAVAKLVKRAYLNRVVDPSNKKRIILQPTREGLATYEKARQGRRAYFLAIMRDLTKRDRLDLDEKLNKVAERIIGLRESD